MNSTNFKVAPLAVALFVVLLMIGIMIFPAHSCGSLNTPRSGRVTLTTYDSSQSALGDTAIDGLQSTADDSSISPASDVQYAQKPISNLYGGTPQISYKLIKGRTDALHRTLELMENPGAHNPSFQELKNFLNSDNTVGNKYVYPDFTCADFALEIQHHAESQGIRCGYAGVDFLGKNEGHALAVFPTIDDGLIYVDDTSGRTILSKNLEAGMGYFNDGIIKSVSNYW